MTWTHKHLTCKHTNTHKYTHTHTVMHTRVGTHAHTQCRAMSLTWFSVFKAFDFSDSTYCSGPKHVSYHCHTLSLLYFFTLSSLQLRILAKSERAGAKQRWRECMNDTLIGGMLDCAAWTHKTSISQFSDVSLKALPALIF